MPVDHDNTTTIIGEIANEDTVPGFVSVGATLIGKNGQVVGEETSFDKISHTLLPKEISPFRIDFPGSEAGGREERSHAAQLDAGAGLGRPGHRCDAAADRDRCSRATCAARANC